MKKGLLFTLVVFVLSAELNAQSARKYVNEFLHLGVGARAFGMGRCAVASTQDVTSGYWNPAGLSQIEDKLQFAFMHNFYFQGLANFDYLGAAAKGNDGTVFGFTLLRFGVDGIPNTLDLIRNGEVNYDRVTSFSAVDYAFMPSFAQEIRLTRRYGTKLSYGGTAKIINRRVGSFAKAWGFGIDVGIKMRNEEQGWSLAVMARDLTSTFNSWDFTFTNAQKDILALTGNTIPENSLEIGLPRLIFGGAYRSKGNKWVYGGEFNLEVTTDGKRNTFFRTGVVSGDFRLGGEVGYINKESQWGIYGRAGLYNFQRQTNNKGNMVATMQPSAGIGIEFQKLSIDYALAGFGSGGAGLYSNVISIRLGINQE